MKAITQQQKLYADYRRMGHFKAEACRLAGYAIETAKQQATKLEKLPQIIAYWERCGFDYLEDPMGEIVQLEVPSRKKEVERIMASKTPGEKALAFLESVIDDDMEDMKIRTDAARFLAKHEQDEKKIVKKPAGDDEPLGADPFAPIPLRVVK